MLIKIYIISSVLALLGIVLLVLRAIDICKEKYNNDFYNDKDDHRLGRVLAYFRVIIISIVPIINIFFALYTLSLFLLFDDEHIIDVLQL